MQEWTIAAARRADMHALPTINRELLRGAHDTMNPQEAKLLVTLHAGAVCTADRAQCHLGRGDGLCRTCNTPAT
eukprot:1916999-Amphidinium_carterae.1